MAAIEPEIEDVKPKRGLLLPLLIGLVLAAAASFAGYWAITAGPLSRPAPDTLTAAEETAPSATDGAYTPVAFVPLETLVISLGAESGSQHLIVTAQLEVDPDYTDEVAALAPRVLDVMNSYLRVVDLSELTAPTSLFRLRAHLLHRIQIVTGSGRVRDLLITQFVVN